MTSAGPSAVFAQDDFTMRPEISNTNLKEETMSISPTVPGIESLIC